MTNKNPSLLVPGQVPEFIAADAPKFVEFLQAYYEFLGEYSYDIQRARDVDQTTSNLVQFLKSEFVARYPKAQIDDRKLIRIVRSMYRSKGTLSAVEMLFQIFFNEAITIQQPGQNILRASDGRWLQEHSITVRRQFGSIDYNRPILLKIENDSGIFFVEVDRTEPISQTDVRFFYKSYRQIAIQQQDQFVDILSSTGDIEYRGLLIKSPSKLKVLAPGNGWKLGQVILFDSSTARVDIGGKLVDALPTIARVTQVGPGGQLESIEVVQYGTSHVEGQSALVSPYPNKPSGADWDLTAEVLSVEEIGGEQIPRYAYTLTLNSYTDGVRETIFGLSNARGGDSYFLEDYTLDFYNARVVLQQERQSSSKTLGLIVTDPELSITDWLASRATLVYEFEYIVKYKGEFFDDRGQVSNTNIRLQDNYFYQLFSYVIQTSKQISEYRNALNLIHPAGLKYFGELTKTADVNLGVKQFELVQSRPRLFLSDSYGPSDNVNFDVIKKLLDIATALEDITSFNITKALADGYLANDADINFDATKKIGDIFTSSETTKFDVDKLLLDIGTSSETTKFDVDKLREDSATATETITKHVTRAPINDPTDANDGSSTINTQVIVYTAEDYFSEVYATTAFALTIG